MAEELDSFGILEEKLTKLLDVYSLLKKERITLDEKLKQKDAELNSLKEKVAVLTKERELAKQKIESLLKRLDHILAHSQAE